MKDDNELNNEEQLNNLSSQENIETEEEQIGDIKSVSTKEITEFIQNDTLGSLMNENYLEYASYVLKDRSLPDVFDGLKPVQRRVLHTMNECDDGRFHKAANIIGATMKYHPHGDASIGEALVTLANKNLFIDTQGNFGNIFTGDGASAPRYIESRLLPLAREVLFNKDITDFVESYDGRNLEPVCFPAKIPVVLLLGVMGIGVTLRSTIFAHNFNEVLDAQIAALEGRPFICYPDFLTGGLIDISNYEDGAGSITARAVIEKTDEKTLTIKEIPAGIPTEKLVDSIEKAYKQNKIKIASINDYTAEEVAIEIKLPRGVYADEVLKQLYVHTDCETKLFSNIIVLYQNRPQKMTVSEVVHLVTERLVRNLGRELEINLQRLQGLHHRKSLTRIFIENRIYKRIEESETEEEVYDEIRSGLEPFQHELLGEITTEDITKLLELCIRKISRFDMNKNQQELDAIVAEISETYYHLTHLREFTIHYIQKIKKKYGHLYPRRSKIDVFHRIDVKKIALQNIKVYHDRVGQFIGSSVKPSAKGAEPLICTEFDRLVLIKADGIVKVTNIPEKDFVGPIKYLFKADKQQIYSMFYREKKTGRYFAKRFQISSYILDKEYALVPQGCVVEAIYTTYGVVANLDLKKRGENAIETVDFNTIALRAWTARGFKVSDFPVIKVTLTKRGSETPNEEANQEGKEVFAKQEEPLEEEFTGDMATISEEPDEMASTINYEIERLIEYWREKADQIVAPIKEYLPTYQEKEQIIEENPEKVDEPENTSKVEVLANENLNVPSKKTKQKKEALSVKMTKSLEEKEQDKDLVSNDRKKLEENKTEELENNLESQEAQAVDPTDQAESQEAQAADSTDQAESQEAQAVVPKQENPEKEGSGEKLYPHPTPLPRESGPRKLIDEDEDFFLR